VPRFDGKVAIVTGGALGIGGAVARRLASEGARVLIADYDEPAGRANAQRIVDAGGQAVVSNVDVSNSADIKRMVQEALDRWKRVDILVQNAFSVVNMESKIYGDAVSVPEDMWDAGMAVLAKAIYLGAKSVVPVMRRQGGGTIVNLGSVHSVLQEWNNLVYETGKAAVLAMTRQMAIQYGPDNIRVNAVGPGHILTEGLKRMWETNPTGLRFFEQTYPLRRSGTPEEAAAAIAFLCSDDASFVTGAMLMVDGGLTVQLSEHLAARQARYAREHPEIKLPFEPGQMI
jgi:NAD(P)-dependent dehydrogenase (short-subunit alcohol dehydrogenase family)